MNILVTGAAGFLGSHLVDRFLADGHAVVGVDNFITGARRNLAHLEGRDDFVLLEHDVSKPLFLADRPEVERLLGPERRLHGVLHFASPASPVDYLELPIQTLKVGALGTHNTLGMALKHGARFLLASTSEVYGDPEVHPQPESYWGRVNPVGPRGVYDEAKRFAEAMTMAYRRAHGVDTRIVRIFNTYGPRMRPGDGRVVSNFIVQALRGEPLTVYGDGGQTRSFCFVEDEVEGIYRLFDSDYPDPMNIGNPNEFTILELAEAVLEEVGGPSDGRPTQGRPTEGRPSSGIEHRALPEDDPKVRRPDISLAKRELGWEPRTSLREGLRRTIPYFRERVVEEDAEARVLGG